VFGLFAVQTARERDLFGNRKNIKISSSSFVIVGFEKPAEGQICVPETPSENPAGKGENRQSIKNEENHKNNFWNESP
jgi:hypothetical protein